MNASSESGLWATVMRVSVIDPLVRKTSSYSSGELSAISGQLVGRPHRCRPDLQVGRDVNEARSQKRKLTESIRMERPCEQFRRLADPRPGHDRAGIDDEVDTVVADGGHRS